MWKRLQVLFGASGMTAFVILFGGLFAEGAAYVVVRRAVRLLESVGALPPLWGSTHPKEVFAVALLVILPFLAYAAVKMFRRSVWVETELSRNGDET